MLSIFIFLKSYMHYKEKKNCPLLSSVFLTVKKKKKNKDWARRLKESPFIPDAQHNFPFLNSALPHLQFQLKQKQSTWNICQSYFPMKPCAYPTECFQGACKQKFKYISAFEVLLICFVIKCSGMFGPQEFFLISSW